MALSKQFGILLAVLSLVTSCQDDSPEPDSSDKDLNVTAISNLVKDVIDEIQENYALDVDRKKLEEGAICGMLESLDEHSLYISDDEFEAFNNSTRGEFLGIGVEIKQITDALEVISIIDGSPAAKADLRACDIITAIDSKPISELNIKQILTKLSGSYTNKINIDVTRNNSEKLNLNIKRGVIQLKTVSVSFDSDIAIVKVSYFNENTSNDLKKALTVISEKDTTKGIVLDLRNNPGGILEQAIESTALFLDDAKIAELKSKNDNRFFYSTGPDITNQKPLVVLIDHNTASGAEIVAAALSDNKRAVLVGEKSRGKGSLQTIIPIPGKGAIKLTTAFFISPSGTEINNNGVTPNIVIETTSSQGEETEDVALRRSLDLILGLAIIEKQNSDQIMERKTDLPKLSP